MALRHCTRVLETGKNRSRWHHGQVAELAHRRRLQGIPVAFPGLLRSRQRRPRAGRRVVRAGLREIRRGHRRPRQQARCHPLSGIRRLRQLGEHL